jgi:hypothetical protein
MLPRYAKWRAWAGSCSRQVIEKRDKRFWVVGRDRQLLPRPDVAEEGCRAYPYAQTTPRFSNTSLTQPLPCRTPGCSFRIDEPGRIRYRLGMTFEERIEALRVRHEALTMNLELLSRDREKDNERIQSLLVASERLLTLAQQDGENIRALAHIAEIHDRRLTNLEGNHE